MALTGGLISAGGALAGLFGGGSASSVPLPPMFTMPNMGDSANSAFSGINAASGTYTPFAQNTLPFAQNIFSGIYNNPLASGPMAGAGVASGLGQNAALTGFGQGANLIGGANSVMGTAFDPQNALYNRTLQQVTDQTRAGLESRGIDNTPYGAGVEGQTLSNFNIDWQNNLLNRQVMGLGAGGTASGIGTNMMNAAPGQFLQAASYPYSTSMGILGNQQTGLTNLLGAGTGAFNLQNAPIQDYLGYLGAGNAINQTANTTAGLALAQQNQQFNQNRALGMGLGQGLYGIGLGSMGIGSPFGGPLMSGLGNMFNTNFTGFGSGNSWAAPFAPSAIV